MYNSSCRKRKRGGERLFKFKNFCQPGFPADFNGPFYQNIKSLLEFGRDEPHKYKGLQTWSFQLEICHQPPAQISLFVVEEPIEQSLCPYCDNCRCIGWGHHLICNKKFHFVLTSKETALREAAQISGSEFQTRIIDVAGKSSCFLEMQGHLMHGVLHSNGFGHLLGLSGVESSSQYLSGHQIMDFWDRICSGLRARKVSLEDVAKKNSIDLRLIHGLAYGEPWFGRWGYKFGHGSYGVTEQMHRKAIEAIQGMPVSLLVQHFGSSDQEILTIVSRYQRFSGNSLQTVGHLVRFMMELKGRQPPESQSVSERHNMILAANQHETVTCRWSRRRVGMATRVIVEAIRKAETQWVPRQEVRDAARASIGDTGLLDFVLKSLGNHVVGNYVVRRAINPVTKVLEYCLEDISNSLRPNLDRFPQNATKTEAPRFHVTRVQLMKDMFYLCQNVLKEPRPAMTPNDLFTAIPTAARIILDTKHLIKDYKGELTRKSDLVCGENLIILCTVCFRKEEEGEERRREALPPCELIVLPAHATIGELKRQVEMTFREIYWGLRTFVAESICELSAQDLDLVFGLAESGCNLVIVGRIEERVSDCKGIYEGGNDNWVVDCPCGAKNDDGERMISCDICEVWQHTRCVQISNSDDDAPHIFLCSRCEHDIVVFPSLL